MIENLKSNWNNKITERLKIQVIITCKSKVKII